MFQLLSDDLQTNVQRWTAKTWALNKPEDIQKLLPYVITFCFFRSILELVARQVTNCCNHVFLISLLHFGEEYGQTGGISPKKMYTGRHGEDHKQAYTKHN